MSSNQHPPQLELQLGHPGFKRSFQQFGLDVDDQEDGFDPSEGSAGSGSASSSSSGGSSGSSFTSASNNGHGHAANERNKRARSEGPADGNGIHTHTHSSAHAHPNQREISLASSTASATSSSNSSDSSYATAPSDVEDERERERTQMDSSSSPHTHTQHTTITHSRSSTTQTQTQASGFSNLHIQAPSSPVEPTYLTGFRYRISGDTPPRVSLPFNFEGDLERDPPTPSIAEFAALRSVPLSQSQSQSQTQTQIQNHSRRASVGLEDGMGGRVPGFSGMRSPRSSSPAPPPMLDIDVPMRESIEDDVDLRPYTIRPRSPQSSQDRNINEYEPLRSATNRLRSAIQRAQELDRTLEPLRSFDDGIQTQSQAQPRLPPFEFEMLRSAGRTPPPHAPSTLIPSSDTLRLPREDNRTRELHALSDSSSLSVTAEASPPERGRELARDAFADLSGARSMSMRIRETHPTPTWLRRHHQSPSRDREDDRVDRFGVPDSILRRRYEDTRPGAGSSGSTLSRSREQENRNSGSGDNAISVANLGHDSEISRRLMDFERRAEEVDNHGLPNILDSHVNPTPNTSFNAPPVGTPPFMFPFPPSDIPDDYISDLLNLDDLDAGLVDEDGGGALDIPNLMARELAGSVGEWERRDWRNGRRDRIRPPSFSAGSVGVQTQSNDGESGRNERTSMGVGARRSGPPPPPRSAGSRLQSIPSSANPYAPFSHWNSEGLTAPRASRASNSNANSDANANLRNPFQVDLSLEASLRHRYPFMNEDHWAGREREPPQPAMSYLYDGHSAGSGIRSVYADYLTSRGRTSDMQLPSSLQSRALPTSQRRTGDEVTDIFGRRRDHQSQVQGPAQSRGLGSAPPATQASFQPRRTRSPSRQVPPTLSLDLSFDASDLYPSFAAQSENGLSGNQVELYPGSAPVSESGGSGMASSAAQQREQERLERQRRPTPSQPFIPPLPSPNNQMRLPSLHSSVFEPLANSPFMTEFGIGSQTPLSLSTGRESGHSGAGGSSAFMTRSQRARNIAGSSEHTWLQPERSPVSLHNTERARLSQGLGSRFTSRLQSNRSSYAPFDNREEGAVSRPPSIRQDLEDMRLRVRRTISMSQQQAEDIRPRERESLRSLERESLRDAVQGGLTRIRELREAHRLSLGSRNANTEREQRPFPQFNALAARDSLTGEFNQRSSNWSEDMDVDGANDLESWGRASFGSHADWMWDREPALSHADELRPMTTGGSSTSTEAAAYFASGPQVDREADRRPSSQLLRQRRLRLSGLAPPSQSSSSSLERGQETIFSQDRFEMSEELDRLDNASRVRSPIGGVSLDELLYSGRNGSTDATDARDERNDRGLESTIMDSLFDDEISTADQISRRGASNGRVNPSTSLTNQQQQQHAQYSAQTARQHQARTSQYPPILPPIQTLGESSIPELADLVEHHESERPAWRLLQGRNAQSSSDLSPHSRRPTVSDSNTAQRGGDLAVHRALLLRSVQSRGGVEVEQATQMRTQSSPPLQVSETSARPSSFHQAMDVLSADGLSTTRREQFLQAHRRLAALLEQDSELERHRSAVRAESQSQTQSESHAHAHAPHVRWGEVHDDPETLGRPPAFRPFRARRRNSTSTLFGPPPENGDSVGTATQNRSNSTTTMNLWGNVENGARSSAEDFYGLTSQSGVPRPRSRYLRERLRDFGGRDREDTLSRSFFRRRQRPGLGNLGDFVRDEDFDSSYESLIALAQSLGDAKPRATPKDVLDALPNGLYKDWQTPGCDTRCPICLDDYKEVDTLLKAEPCNHWCHKDCFEQWLHTANTCPVCRSKISSRRVSVRSPPPTAGPSGTQYNTSTSSTSPTTESSSPANATSQSSAATSTSAYSTLGLDLESLARRSAAHVGVPGMLRGFRRLGETTVPNPTHIHSRRITLRPSTPSANSNINFTSSFRPTATSAMNLNTNANPNATSVSSSMTASAETSDDSDNDGGENTDMEEDLEDRFNLFYGTGLARTLRNFPLGDSSEDGNEDAGRQGNRGSSGEE